MLIIQRIHNDWIPRCQYSKMWPDGVAYWARSAWYFSNFAQTYNLQHTRIHYTHMVATTVFLILQFGCKWSKISMGRATATTNQQTSKGIIYDSTSNEYHRATIQLNPDSADSPLRATEMNRWIFMDLNRFWFYHGGNCVSSCFYA